MKRTRRTISEGLLVGGVAYVAAVALYGLFDVLAARDALFTADMLGRVLFMGLRDPAIHLFPHQLDPAAVLWAGGLQLPLSLVAGLGAAAIVQWGVTYGVNARRLISTVAAAGALSILGVALLLRDLPPVLPWSSLLVANALAFATAISLLFRRRQVIIGE